MEHSSLDRLEKSTSLVRNCVFIIAALVPALFFISREFTAPVRVELDQMYIYGSRIVMIDRNYLKELTKPENDNLISSATMLDNAGRLDSIAHLFVLNTSRATIHLRIILTNRRTFVLPGPERLWDPLPRNQFLLIDSRTSCAMDDSLITLGIDNRLGPDETGTVEIREFPAGCQLRLEIGHARSNAISLEVYANGVPYNPTPVRSISGWLGQYALRIQNQGILGYIVFLVLPLVFFVLLGVYAVRFLASTKKITPKAEVVPSGQSKDGGKTV